jgi:hypothetical protein
MSAVVISLIRLGCSLVNREPLFVASGSSSFIYEVGLLLRRSSACSSVKLAYESGDGIWWPGLRCAQRHRRRFG